MQPPYIHPVANSPGADKHQPYPLLSREPAPGFEAWLGQAMAAQPAAPDPALQHGPADYGLWGVSPDSDGRLNLDEVAANLRATLPALAGNLGKVCRNSGIGLPPPLRLLAGIATQPSLPFDRREAAIQQLFDDWPALAHQYRRLAAGFGFIRCSDALRAYQRVIGRLGPGRLAHGLAPQGDAHATPQLALVFDGNRIWPEEALGERWRPLAGLEQLTRELLEGASPATVREPQRPLHQVLDPADALLRAARQRS